MNNIKVYAGIIAVIGLCTWITVEVFNCLIA